MVAAKFDALLTFDKNLQHQQNFSKYSITVFVLTALTRLMSCSPVINWRLDQLLSPLNNTAYRATAAIIIC
jgi:hypothetical protein